MNKTAIKNYAIWARVQLIEAVKQKAFEYEVTGNGENKYDLDSAAGRLLSKTEKEQRQKLLDLIRQKGFEQVMEEAAYTWFNRFIALRFMEVNGYLPSKVRVFTDENGTFKPEIMKQAMTVDLDGLDREIVFDLLDKQNNEELYKYLLITQCNALHEGLPGMFEKIGAWTELLFPKNLLRDDSVIAKMISEIPEEDWTDQVEIIGWLYQYYNTEPKDKVFSRPSGQKIRKEDVPAATQLFTPDWIVRYMVENSLGRLWAENPSASHTLGTSPKGEAAEVAEKMGWKYYLPEAEQSDDVQAKLLEMRKSKAQTSIEEITFLDPCMGSGHILVYAFDVFMQIYTSQGYTERDAAQKIVENNLYGLELDDRAAQLAYFAVMMKARSYDRRFLGRGIRPNLCSIQESNNINPDYLELFGELKETARKLYDEFIDAKEYGSILNLKITADEITQLEEKCSEIIDKDKVYDNIFDTIRQVGLRTDFVALIRQAKIMVQKYSVVCTNPPYMGGSGMSAKLSAFVKKFYPDSKADLFSTFMEKAYMWAKSDGYTSLITMESWMFLSSFEKLRERIINEKTIINMVHMPYLGKGGTSLGINFGTAAVIMQNRYLKDYSAQYEYTVYYETDENGVPFVFPTINSRWKRAKQSDFNKIPGIPIAYWLSKETFDLFLSEKISDRFYALHGFITGHDQGVTFNWYEVSFDDFSTNISSQEDLIEKRKKYVPLSRGGEFRRWYGVGTLAIRFDNWAMNYLKDYPEFNLKNKAFYFKKAISWPLITTRGLSLRYISDGYIFGNNGPAIFSRDNNFDEVTELLGFLNTKVAYYFETIINPTMSCSAGVLKKIPISHFDDCNNSSIVNDCIDKSKKDWDSFETSWDFKKHPLI